MIQHYQWNGLALEEQALSYGAAYIVVIETLGERLVVVAVRNSSLALAMHGSPLEERLL